MKKAKAVTSGTRETELNLKKIFGNYANSMPSREAIKAFDNASFVAIKRIQ